MRSTHFLYLGALILAGMYLYLTLAMPPTASKGLGLSETGLLVLRGSFVLLYALTLFVGVKSIDSLWAYASTLGNGSTEIGKGLMRVGTGLLWLIGGFGVTVTISSLRGVIAPVGTPTTPDWEALTILVNYAYLLFPAAGLWIILSGARVAANEDTVGWTRRRRDDIIVAIVFSLIVTILYGILTFTNPDRQVTEDLFTRPTYVLSDSMILFTLVVPSFFVWIVGILAAFELDRMSLHNASPLFRRARRRLVNGLWGVIFSSILLQALLSLGGSRLVSLGLVFILLAIYGYFILVMAGYFTIMQGARKLAALST